MTAYRGLVTAVTDKGAFVQIPRMMPGVKQGPFSRAVGVDLQKGDSVILLQLERDEDLVIVAKIATSSVNSRERLLALAPVEDYHAATKKYVDDAIAAIP